MKKSNVFWHLISKFANRYLILRITCTALVVLVGAGVAWIFVGSLYEDRLDRKLVEPARTTKDHVVVIDSVDPDSGVAQVHVNTTANPLAIATQAEHYRLTYADDPDVQKGIFDFNKIRLFNGPLELMDLAPDFQEWGLRPVQQFFWSFPDKPLKTYTESTTLSLKSELTVLGKPTLYPFDTYLIMARPHSATFATLDGSRFIRLPGESYSVDLRAPGFVALPATGGDLEHWPTRNQRWQLFFDAHPEVKSPIRALYASKYEPLKWRDEQFAILLKRPFFLRALTIFLGAIALFSVFAIAVISDKKKIAVEAAAYFLALWAVRNVLSTGGPKSATLLDYAVIVLYSLLMILISIRLIWQNRPPEKDSSSNP